VDVGRDRVAPAIETVYVPVQLEADRFLAFGDPLAALAAAGSAVRTRLALDRTEHAGRGETVVRGVAELSGLALDVSRNCSRVSAMLVSSISTVVERWRCTPSENRPPSIDVAKLPRCFM
jgi:hypothetical protein